MDERSKVIAFTDFQKKAFERLEQRKKKRYRTLYVPSVNCNIKIQGLNTAEITGIMDMDTEVDKTRADRYMVYEAVVEPSLKELANKAKDEGQIVDYLDITEIFDYHEVQEICLEVMDLSGYTGASKIKVVEDLKN